MLAELDWTSLDHIALTSAHVLGSYFALPAVDVTASSHDTETGIH